MIKNRPHSRRGNTMVEAAIIFPVLLYIVLGCIDFGQMLYIKHTLQGAAREGARRAATPNTTNAQAIEAVNDSMSAAGFTPSKYTVKILNAAGNTNINVAQTAGTPIQVRVECLWKDVGVQTSGGLIPVIKADKVLSGATTMRKEG